MCVHGAIIRVCFGHSTNPAPFVPGLILNVSVPFDSTNFAASDLYPPPLRSCSGGTIQVPWMLLLQMVAKWAMVCSGLWSTLDSVCDMPSSWGVKICQPTHAITFDGGYLAQGHF